MVRAVSGIMLTLLLIGMLTLAFNIQSVKSEPTTWTVDDDGPADFHTIQEAINAASPGDTIYVYNGTYYERVVVNKSVSLIGEEIAKPTINATGPPVSYINGTYSTVRICVNNVAINGFEIQNPTNDYGIFLNHSSNSIIHENIVKGTFAIIVEGGSGNTISDNKVEGLEPSSPCVFEGIRLTNSSNNVVTGNYLSSDCHNALILHNSHNNYVAFNYMANHFSPFPLYIWNSNNNSIVDNTIWSWGNPAGHIGFTESSNNVLYHNNFLLWRGSSIISIDDASMNNAWDDGYPSGGNYWINYTGVDANGDGIGDTPYVIDADNQDRYPLMHPWSSLPVHNINTGLGYATIQEAINAEETVNGHLIFVDSGTCYEHVTIDKSISLVGENRETTVIDGEGTGNVVLVEGADNVTVTGFTVRNGSSGFYILGFNHTIIGNIISNNTHHGIDLVGRNNRISENIITNNLYGIIFGASNYNIISRNTIINNQGGISLCEDCEDNDISENTLMSNTMGIGVVGNNNSVVGNTIKENWYGIEIAGINNTIYHNNFINNIVQANVTSGYVNIWDDGYPSGGNYWSNYTGNDMYSGPYPQSLAGSDGIGDTPHVIDDMNRDYYPLKIPFVGLVPGDANHDGHVNLSDLSLLASYWFNIPAYNPAVDFNMNGFVNLSDLSILADHWYKGPKD